MPSITVSVLIGAYRLAARVTVAWQVPVYQMARVERFAFLFQRDRVGRWCSRAGQPSDPRMQQEIAVDAESPVASYSTAQGMQGYTSHRPPCPMLGLIYKTPPMALATPKSSARDPGRGNHQFHVSQHNSRLLTGRHLTCAHTFSTCTQHSSSQRPSRHVAGVQHARLVNEEMKISRAERVFHHRARCLPLDSGLPIQPQREIMGILTVASCSQPCCHSYISSSASSTLGCDNHHLHQLPHFGTPALHQHGARTRTLEEAHPGALLDSADMPHDIHHRHIWLYAADAEGSQRLH
jgi:hypothetical protein